MLRTRYCFCVLCAALGLAMAAYFILLAPQPAAAQNQAGKGPVSFINDVAPILKENCFSCHDSKKRKGKLDMTTFESLRKGGENDNPIKDGKPDDSLLIQLMTTTTSKRMPPKENGDLVPKEKVAVI